ITRRIPAPLPAVEACLDLLTTLQSSVAALPSDVAGRTLARLVSADPIEDPTVRAFGALLHTDECRASLYSFFTLQAARKRSRPPGALPASSSPPRGAPTRGASTRVGVIGGGLMACQLAVLFADRLNAAVHLTELTPERAQQALVRVLNQLDRMVVRGSLTPARRDRLAGLVTASDAVADQAGSTIVIEAVFEDLAVKRGVWAAVEAVVSLDCVLLTNTSSLSITDQGADLLRPERLVGFHFFNPVAVLPLVEIVRSAHTSRAVVDTAFGLAGALGKTAVLVADQPGFVVNRILTRLFSDTLALIDGGADVGIVDGALVNDGLPMTALTLLGYIGPAVQLHILTTMHESYPDRFAVSPSLVALVDSGLPGYLGRDGKLTPEAAAVLSGVVPSAVPVLREHDEVREHLLRGLADETARMVADNTVAAASDIDACMILGGNYPQHTGGLTALLDRSGASHAANGRRFHPHGVASLPREPEPVFRP
ncbi:MAG: 3-hydroxyacyl-CoA dehydrogenase family protein, partial [Cryobacterium sp.]